MSNEINPHKEVYRLSSEVSKLESRITGLEKNVDDNDRDCRERVGKIGTTTKFRLGLGVPAFLACIAFVVIQLSTITSLMSRIDERIGNLDRWVQTIEERMPRADVISSPSIIIPAKKGKK